MIFAVLNLEPPDGPFAAALRRIASVREDLQLHPEYLSEAAALGPRLRSVCRERFVGGSPQQRQSVFGETVERRAAVTDAYVFIDGSVASADDLFSALSSGLATGPTGEARESIHISVLFHSMEFVEGLKELVRRCESELTGLFVYRVLPELDYGATRPLSRRLQYAIEALFSTNWTRLARDPAERSRQYTRTNRSRPRANNRLEPFDDHGPFLSQQIHDLSQIIAITTLGSFDDALTAALESYATSGERAALPPQASLVEKLSIWQTTADFWRRYRRFHRVLQLYGEVAPSLDDDTVAYFDETRYPTWLDQTTLQVVPGASLSDSIDEFVDAMTSQDPDASKWGLHWLRAADAYLRRLREQVIT